MVLSWADERKAQNMRHLRPVTPKYRLQHSTDRLHKLTEENKVRSLVVLLVLGSAMAVAQDAATARTTPIPNSAMIRQTSGRAESYCGVIGLMCLLALAGLRPKARKKDPDSE